MTIPTTDYFEVAKEIISFTPQDEADIYEAYVKERDARMQDVCNRMRDIIEDCFAYEIKPLYNPYARMDALEAQMELEDLEYAASLEEGAL